MSLKPIDLQTNILQMNNAAKEVNKSKDVSLQQQQYAHAMSNKESLEKDSKISEIDAVEQSTAPLEDEFKDSRSKQEKEKRNFEGKNKAELKEEEKSFFDDPKKGFLIDIKE